MYLTSYILVTQTSTARMTVMCDSNTGVVTERKKRHNTSEGTAVNSVGLARCIDALGVYFSNHTVTLQPHNAAFFRTHVVEIAVALDNDNPGVRSVRQRRQRSSRVISRCGWLLQRRGLPSRIQWGFFLTVSGTSVVDFLKERKWNPESRT